MSCDDDDYPYSEIPSVVLNKFWAEYPGATDVSFIQVDKNYEIEFELNGKEAKTIIASPGDILKEKKEVSWSALPPAARASLEKDFEKKEMEDVEVINTGKNSHYQVTIDGLFRDKQVVLDSAGNVDEGLSFWE